MEVPATEKHKLTLDLMFAGWALFRKASPGNVDAFEEELTREDEGLGPAAVSATCLISIRFVLDANDTPVRTLSKFIFLRHSFFYCMSKFFVINFIQQVAFAEICLGIRYRFVVAEFIDND